MSGDALSEYDAELTRLKAEVERLREELRQAYEEIARVTPFLAIHGVSGYCLAPARRETPGGATT